MGRRRLRGKIKKGVGEKSYILMNFRS